jgi:nitronate monooxygenase
MHSSLPSRGTNLRSGATALGPLKAAAEKLGRVDFTNLWAGQAVRLGRDMPAAELTRALAGAALARLSRMAG